MPPQPQQSYALPIAILLGFGIIAVVIFFASVSESRSALPTVEQPSSRGNTEHSTEVKEPVPPVTNADFIRGNPEAPIMFVTYMDYECATCKNFHATMNRIIQEYGMTGQVAWTMRHMPMPEIHDSALPVANAAECAGDLGGPHTFWDYADTIFEERDFFSTTELEMLTSYADTLDLDATAFARCMEENTYYDHLTSTADDAFAAGAAGAPYTVVITGENQGALNGAQPHRAMQDVTERLLAQLEAFVEQETPEETLTP